MSNATEVRADLAPLYEAALAADEPGAWIREAIEQMMADESEAEAGR